MCAVDFCAGTSRPDRSVKKEEEMFLYLECGHVISQIYSRSNTRITSKWSQGLEPIPADTGREKGYTLDKLPENPLANIERQTTPLKLRLEPETSLLRGNMATEEVYWGNGGLKASL
ncbi:unnamed protein product [Pleuronectes platessa]|uniref:Uncharacterized protein n=1 Tax=Pleuronectes platessa TaxID=8262 RepID=A0A9N7YL15_PLEPL|nr:unnamed protein product [Pleuronectes platessa]